MAVPQYHCCFIATRKSLSKSVAFQSYILPDLIHCWTRIFHFLLGFPLFLFVLLCESKTPYSWVTQRTWISSTMLKEVRTAYQKQISEPHSLLHKKMDMEAAKARKKGGWFTSVQLLQSVVLMHLDLV